MTKFTCKLFARPTGAIGIKSDITDSVIMPDNSSLDEVRLKCYDKYEHIHGFEILSKEVITPTPDGTEKE